MSADYLRCLIEHGIADRIGQRHREILFRDMEVVLRSIPKRSLTLHGLVRLYRRICDIRGQFDIHRFADDSSSTASEASQKMDPIISAIGRIARFAKEPKELEDRASRNFGIKKFGILVRLASSNLSEQAQPVILSEDDIECSLREFLDKAVLIHSWLKDRPRAGLSPGFWGNDISAEQWLLGEALPELYERTFQERWTVSRNAQQDLQGEALGFVEAVLKVMKCTTSDGSPTWARETIVSYRRRAAKARAGMVQPSRN